MADPETRTTAEPDYDLLRANLDRVFNERDADKRATALAELFVDEPVMYEPSDVVHGRHAISTVAGKLLDQFGPTFRFTPVGRAVGHHGLGSLSWQAGPPSGRVAGHRHGRGRDHGRKDRSSLGALESARRLKPVRG